MSTHNICFQEEIKKKYQYFQGEQIVSPVAMEKSIDFFFLISQEKTYIVCRIPSRFCGEIRKKQEYR